MRLDPIKLEIIGKKFSAVLDEMYFAIQRASRSSYVKEAADFSTGVLDTDGNIFAYPPSATFNFLVDSYFVDTIRAFPDVEPGDVILTNDPYLSGGLSTHLPDFHLVRPYFHGDRLIGYGWSFVHCADVGGAVPTSMSPALTDIFQEGIRLPPLKLVKAGVLNEDDRLDHQGEHARARDDDGRPQGDARRAEHRRDPLRTSWRTASASTTCSRRPQDLQDYAAAKSKDVFRKIPDGAYEFWDYMDDDFVSRIPVRIRVRVVAKDGEILLDLTGTDPQVKSAYNVPTMGQRIYWLTFRLTSFLTTFDPADPEERRDVSGT